MEKVEQLNLDRTVEFVDEYLPRKSLQELLQRAAAVIVPYDSTEQVVSGVLVEAVAALVPTIATAFPHAVELAEEGAVLTVPHQSPKALADAIAGLLDSPQRRRRMVQSQRRLAPSLEWASVAARYERVVRDVARTAVTVEP
jgi:glycosyltransferase involved in cell wall biosynthesis